MDPLTSQELGRVCQIFLDLAYPAGMNSMPSAKQVYYRIDSAQPVDEYLPPAKHAASVCKALAPKSGRLRGYEFRLGSTRYPHLKLQLQYMTFRNQEVRVYSVDTHDMVVQSAQHTPEEAEIWRVMMLENRALKHQIEGALGQAGYLTPVQILQLGLQDSDTSP